MEAKKLVDIFPKLYLGFKNENLKWDQVKREYFTDPSLPPPGLDPKKFPLAFATPFIRDNAYFQKRKKTVDNWADRNWPYNAGKPVQRQGIFIDNDPLEGFEIFDFESRWTTSNKLFCIKDPRGFHLQVSAANLVDIIREATIVNGVIQGKCVWARRDGQNVLLPCEGDIYKTNVSLDARPLTYGIDDRIISRHKNDLVYMGEYYRIERRLTFYDHNLRHEIYMHDGNILNRPPMHVHSSYNPGRVTLTINYGAPEKVHVYHSYNGSADRSQTCIETFKAKVKPKAVIGKYANQHPELIDHRWAVGEYGPNNDFYFDTLWDATNYDFHAKDDLIPKEYDPVIAPDRRSYTYEVAS